MVINCSRLSVAFGANFPFPTPLTTPVSAAQSTAVRYQSAVRSVKLLFSAAGSFSMRQRIVTIIARVIAASGENVDALVPFIRPFSVT